jgi:hypothetical protein
MQKWLVMIATLALLVSVANSRESSLRSSGLSVRAGISASDRVTVDINQTNLAQALIMYSELTGRTQLPKTSPISEQVDEFFGGYLSRWHLVKARAPIRSGIEYHRDGLFSVGEVKDHLEEMFAANRLVIVPQGKKYFRAIRSSEI